MQRERSVLIVDPCEENRDILRTALARRGLRTHTAAARDEGLSLAREHQPELIVVDLEVASVAAEEFSRPMAATLESPPPPPSIVVLGTCHHTRQSLPSGEFVSKPYHYGPLLRRIEELLKTSQTATR